MEYHSDFIVGEKYKSACAGLNVVWTCVGHSSKDGSAIVEKIGPNNQQCKLSYVTRPSLWKEHREPVCVWAILDDSNRIYHTFYKFEGVKNYYEKHYPKSSEYRIVELTEKSND